MTQQLARSMTIEEFVPPTLFMPFIKADPSPWMAQAEEEMWTWIDAFDLAPNDAVRRHIRRTRPELMAALYFPTAGPEILPLLAQYVAWGFMVDDEFDEGPIGHNVIRCEAAVKSLYTVLQQDAPVTRSPLALALADLWRRTSPYRSTGWRDQMVADIRDWLYTYLTEAHHRTSGHVPSSHEFWEHRQLTIGMRMFMDLGEIVAGTDVPEQARHCPALLAMRRAAAEQIALVNDIFSVRKDRAHGFIHNHVIIIQQTERCDLQDAIDRANELAAGCIDRFLAAEKRLPPELDAAGVDCSAGEGVLRCVDGLGALIRGNYDWHFEVERYTNFEEVAPGLPDYVPDLFARISREDG
jgi:(+)-beta-caryophyllene/(+)-caryolan-1-ol synthase